MKIEAGKTYVDGSGNKVRIVCVDRKTAGPYEVVGLRVKHDYSEDVAYYASTGKGWGVSSLVKEYKEPSYTWINVHVDGRIDGSYMTRAFADSWANSNLMMWGATKGKRIGLLKIDCETGQAENIKLEA